MQTLTLAQAHSKSAGYLPMGIAVLDAALCMAGRVPADLVAG